MTTIDRFEHELPSALSDVAGVSRPDYLSDILGRTARTRQRPAWASLERWLPMDIATSQAPMARVPWRALGLIALVALLLAALVAVYAGSQPRRVPAPFGPAANGKIPYDANGDIYLGDPVTGTTRLLAGGPEDDHDAAFSPDGTKVGWLRRAPTGDAIVVANADGTNLRTLTPTPLYNLLLASWIPAGDGIIVDHTVAGRQLLQILPIDGTAPRLLAEDVAADNVSFRPPDGRELLLSAKVNGSWGLYTMSIDGGPMRQLAVSTLEGDHGQDLDWASYAADGSTITYNRYVPERDTIELWTMNADGSNQHRFNADEPRFAWEGEAVGSPDGKWLATWRVNDDGPNQILLRPADGSGTPAVLEEPVDVAHWVWAPDSTALLVNPIAGTGVQHLIDIASMSVTPLPWNANSGPDWQRTAH